MRRAPLGGAALVVVAAVIGGCLFTVAVCQNLTANTGGTARFLGRPFKDTCVWEYLGADQTAVSGKDVLYADDTAEYDLVYHPYKDRIQKSFNCTFQLTNVQAQDEGWYRMTRDLGQTPDNKSLHYLHVVGKLDNRRSHAVGFAIIASSLLLLLIVFGILMWKCKNSQLLHKPEVCQPVYTCNANSSVLDSNGITCREPQQDPSDTDPLHNGIKSLR